MNVRVAQAHRAQLPHKSLRNVVPGVADMLFFYLFPMSIRVHGEMLFCALPDLTQDGTAILWRECLTHESAANPNTPAGPMTTAATAAPKVRGVHGGQLLPAAIMRGYGGAHVWRLAVHEFDPCSIDDDRRNSGSCCAPAGCGTIAERSPGRGLVLMATGGNDGASKLWDLEFEAACESGNGQASRWEAKLGTSRYDVFDNS